MPDSRRALARRAGDRERSPIWAAPRHRVVWSAVLQSEYVSPPHRSLESSNYGRGAVEIESSAMGGLFALPQAHRQGQGRENRVMASQTNRRVRSSSADVDRVATRPRGRSVVATVVVRALRASVPNEARVGVQADFWEGDQICVS